MKGMALSAEMSRVLWEQPKAVMLTKTKYRPGEVVYVKEPWRIGAWLEDEARIAVDYKDFIRKEWLDVQDGILFERLWKESTDDAEKVYGRQEGYIWKPGESPCRWRSPVSMPAFVSRLHLRIVSVRPERYELEEAWRA